jgi:hypothetical protein
MSNNEFPERPFTVSDARAFGIGKRRLLVGVREDAVRRVLRGVYVRADLPDTPGTRAAAAALVISRHSVVCDRTAAWLHGVDVFGYADKDILPPIETCVYRGHANSRRVGVDGRSRDLLDEDVMMLDGLRVTTPLRTAADLACCLGRHRALGALDQFMRDHAVTRDGLQELARRYFRRRGVRQLRELIPLADPRAESMRESWIRLDIHDAGLPMPELQWWMVIDGVPTYRLDLAYPKHRVAVEYDGEDFHRRSEKQRAHDRERRKCLRDHGWTVIVVDKDGIADADLAGWIGELRRALQPRTRRLRWVPTHIS